MSTVLEKRRLRQKLKFQMFQKKREKEILTELLGKKGYSEEEIQNIIDKKIVGMLQQFIKRYQLIDKNPANDCGESEDTLVKFKQDNQIYEMPLKKVIKSLEISPLRNPVTQNIMSGAQLSRLQRKIKPLNPFKFEPDRNIGFRDITGYYKRFEDSWNMQDVVSLQANRGMVTIEPPTPIYNRWFELQDQNPGVYCVEVMTDDIDNTNRAYCSFRGAPNHKRTAIDADYDPEYDDDYDNDRIELPLNVYNTLNVLPDEVEDFKIRIVKPPKATKIVLRSMVNKEGLVSDVKQTFEQEIRLHRILYEKQIITIQSDKDGQLLPFYVEQTEPGNVVDITEVNVTTDFKDALQYDDAVTALMCELNS